MSDGGVAAGASMGGDAQWDFFVACAPVDRDWGAWVAWTLEAAGFEAWFGAWDTLPGANRVSRVQLGISRSARVLVVLSDRPGSDGGEGEWHSFWEDDPAGRRRTVLVVRVAELLAPPLLRGLAPIDLFGLSEVEASTRLTSEAAVAVRGLRTKPAEAPSFPSGDSTARRPPFPAEAARTPASVDDALANALAATADRHARLIESRLPKAAGPARPFAERLVGSLTAADGPIALVVHGRAGSGKSTVTAETVRQLRELGWTAAVVRMDTVGDAVRTADALGRACDLLGSPVALAAEVAAGAPAVVLVDQLDAVSEYSGRMADSFEAVDDLLRQAESALNVRIVLAVRTVDLEEDPRMRNVLADSRRVAKVELDDLEPAEVLAVLSRLGVDAAALDAAMLELLRVPLHLAVYCGLSASSRHRTYATLTELYARYIGDFRQRITKKIGTLDWERIVAAVTAAMNDRESLVVPAPVVDSQFPPEQIRALESEGVLLRQGSQVGFFHETFFDFVFASGFVAAGRDLHDFLIADRQALFRRAQTRQVLEYLAEIDRMAFLTSARRLLTSDRIRSHLLDVVIAVLRRLPATAQDWAVIEPLAFDTGRRSAQLAGLLAEPAWFDAADEALRWEALLDGPATQDLAARAVIAAARCRPDRVAELVAPRLGRAQPWQNVLLPFATGSGSAGLADLVVRLIERGDLDGLYGKAANGFDFWLQLNGTASRAPADAAKPAGAWLRRAVLRARADGSEDPFESGHLLRRSPSGPGVIGKIAADAPDAFVQEIYPIVVDVVTRAARPAPEGRLHRWTRGRIPGVPNLDGALIDGAAEALRQLAGDQPALAAELARELAASDVFELRQLACRVWAALPDLSDEAVDWLLSDDQNLYLYEPSHELVEAASQYCDDEHLRALVLRLLDYYHEDEATGPRRGQTQYWLLTAVDPARRSPVAEQRLAELAPAFAQPLAPFEDSHSGNIEPPISADEAALLSDNDWALKIREYPHDTVDWSRRPPVSGAPGLASRVRDRATVEPERFAALALTLGPDVAPVYLSSVVSAVAGKVPADLFTNLCVHIRAVAGLEAGAEVCRAIGRSAAAEPALLTLVENFLDDTDPAHDAEAKTARTQDDENTAAFHRDATRAAAGEVIAQVLHTAPEHTPRLLPAIWRLAADPAPAVRDAAALTARVLLGIEADTALQIAVIILDAATGEEAQTVRLLGAAFEREPERFASYLLRAMTGSEPVAEYGGAVWAHHSLRGPLPAPLPRTIRELSDTAQQGAAEQFAAQPVEATDQLVALFDDPEERVRHRASIAFERLDQMPATTATRLVAAFTTSAAFAENLDTLFHALQRSNRLLPETALDACQRAIAMTGNDLGDIRTAAAGASIDIIGLVLRIYRQADEPLRRRCLDLIDDLSDAGALDLQNALAAAR